MSRFPSLRSIWTTARYGIFLTSIFASCCFSSPVFSQKYDDKEAMSSYGGYNDVGAPMGSTGERQAATLANIASGVSRPDNFSSVNAVQALLYADAVGVIHLNFNKIDFEGLSAFVDELVDKGAGSVRSDDKYRVQLREYQKAELKSSFKRFLSTIQNMNVEGSFKNYIDECYFIKYESADNKVLGAVVMACPTAGLNEANVKSAIDAINERMNPVTTFVRYGFIIAVLEHDAETPLDTSEIDARFEENLVKSQNRLSGSYTTNSVNTNDYSLNGGSASRPSSSAGSLMNGDANNSAQVLREYLEEVSEAKDKNRAQSRRDVLPRVRNRFAQSASENDSAKLMRGLKFTDGAAFTAVARATGALSSVFNAENGNGSLPFSGLGFRNSSSKVASWSNQLLGSINETLDEQVPDAAESCITVSVSLVGSPRVVVFMGLADENEAKSCEKSINLALTALKPIVLKSIQDAIVSTGADLDSVNLSPMVNEIFEGLKPRVSGSDVAIVLNLDPIKANAAAFMPLLGGVESKSQQEIESETIDWSLGEKKLDESAQDSDVLFDDEPQSEEDSIDEDAPLGDDEDEENGVPVDDPFA